MKGYIIESERGNFLAEDLIWFNHEKVTEAYVHSKSIIHRMYALECEQWNERPLLAYPATRDKDKGIAIISKPEKIINLYGKEINR